MTIQPRLLRLRDAPTYLGMNINYFNKEVRPHVVEIRIGSHGIAFDRLDLDAFAEQYKGSNRCPIQESGGSSWDKKRSLDSLTEMGSGILKSDSSEDAFEKALALATSHRQRSISHAR